MRNPIRKIDGLLSHPDIHPQRTDRHHILGELLVEQKRHSGQSRVGRDHRVNHDHAHVFHQRRVAQDILREIHRRLLGHVFRHGFRIAVGLVNTIVVLTSVTYTRALGSLRL